MSVHVFDPLDRQIPNEQQNQATKRDDIVTIINDMPFIKGDQLIVPLKNHQLRNLNKMFENEKLACNEVIESLRDQIKQNQDNLGNEIILLEHPKIKEVYDIMEFFAQHQLIKTAVGDFGQFKQHIQIMQTIIDKEKDQENMNKLQQTCLKFFKDMHQRKEEGNLPVMTKTMLDYYRILEELERRTDADLLQTKQSIIEEVDTLIKQLSNT